MKNEMRDKSPEEYFGSQGGGGGTGDSINLIINNS